MLAYAILITAFCILLLIVLGMLIHRNGYLQKILVKLGLKEQKEKTNWAVFSWNNTMEKLDYQADVVFFGDSIIRGSDFRKQFPHKKIVNLGYSGDTLSGMIKRIPMITAMHPQQVFILGGINGLTNRNADRCIAVYEKLLNEIRQAMPFTKIYIHSLLPLSSEKERKICKNQTILCFNQRLRSLAEARNIPFIDLYTLYAKDGVLNPDLTVDGIHLFPHAYERWATALHPYLSPINQSANQKRGGTETLPLTHNVPDPTN